MDEQPIIAPIAPPPLIEEPKPRRLAKTSIAGISIGLIILVIVAAIAIQMNQKNQVATHLTPQPTIPTPTPIRILSKIATESAFMNLETSVTSLSAVIAGYPISDPSLTPAKLDLSIGFR